MATPRHIVCASTSPPPPGCVHRLPCVVPHPDGRPPRRAGKGGWSAEWVGGTAGAGYAPSHKVEEAACRAWCSAFVVQRAGRCCMRLAVGRAAKWSQHTLASPPPPLAVRQVRAEQQVLRPDPKARLNGEALGEMPYTRQVRRGAGGRGRESTLPASCSTKARRQCRVAAAVGACTAPCPCCCAYLCLLHAHTSTSCTPTPPLVVPGGEGGAAVPRACAHGASGGWGGGGALGRPWRGVALPRPPPRRNLAAGTRARRF